MNFNKTIIFLTLLIFWASFSSAQSRWQIAKDGGINWNVKSMQNHADHVEMSGLKVSTILTYGVDQGGQLVYSKQLVFPMLRTIPNNTHASLSRKDVFNVFTQLKADGELIKEYPVSFYQKGFLKVSSANKKGLVFERYFYPSTTKACFIERNTIVNQGTKDIEITFPDAPDDFTTPASKGVEGSYIFHTEITAKGNLTLKPNQKIIFSVSYSARKVADALYYIDADYELQKRKDFVAGLGQSLVLKTPDVILNTMFEFAKIRATESIYDTKGGLMHGPGGNAYYAAIWANDQAEYANPFFPFLGNAEGLASAENSFRHFARFMNPDFKPIPSSIVAEGETFWNGAGDRGDQAMIAYGASRFALANGNRYTAEKLWPLIEWCLAYLDKKKNTEGVIASDADELEGRFPAGKINLSTNCLAYGGLQSAANLALALGKDKLSEKYLKDAADLNNAIEKYFGATVQGYKTYRYYEGNDKLRAWICLPLTMGILDRKNETSNALLSPKLWSVNGILTEEGDKTFWDRGTLYAFRGLFNTGFTDTAKKYLQIYSTKRLLGDHVPYAVEAWPEGGQRHLSAESALYCRTLTEGLFGIEPIGLKSFKLKPNLPKGWDSMELNHIKAFESDLSINVQKQAQGKTLIKIYNQGALIYNISWDGKSSVTIKI